MDKEKQESARPDYNEILFNAIYESYSRVCKEFGLKDGEDICLDPYIVRTVIDRCIRDFDRLAVHHYIPKANSHKISGYLTYWLNKLCPIKVLMYDLYDSGINYYINQIFSLVTGITIVNHEKKRRELKAVLLNNKSLNLFDLRDVLMDYLYTLRYCDLNPDLLSMLYYYADITAGGVHISHNVAI